MTDGSPQRRAGGIGAFLRTPAYEDESRNRRARMIDGFAVGMYAISALSVTFAAIIQPELHGLAASRLTLLTVLYLSVLAVNRVHHQRVAAVLLVVGPFVIVSSTALMTGGLRSPGLQCFFVLSLMAALLFGEGAGIRFGIACVVTTLAFALADSLQALPPPLFEYNVWVLWTLNAMYVGFFVVSLRISMRTLRRALTRSEDELGRRRIAEAQLEAYQHELESLVLQRTDELRRKYDELAKLEKMRDTLVHMVVHDLRSPLAAMCGLLDALERDAVALPGESRGDIATCRATAQQMTMMVTAVLDVNKIETASMEIRAAACDVVEVTRTVIDEMKGLARGITVTLSPDAAVPAVADADLLRRVVQNLLGNALRYSPDGGTVDVRVAETPVGTRISVTDRGPGVPADARELIFAKFRTLESRGHSSGLGLAFCRMAIEAHGGAIGVRPGPGGTGSEFWFEIPHPSAEAGKLAA